MKLLLLMLVLCSSVSEAAQDCSYDNTDFFKFVANGKIQMIRTKLSSGPCEESVLSISIYDKTEQHHLYSFSINLNNLVRFSIDYKSNNVVSKSHSFVEAFISDFVEGEELPDFGRTRNCGVNYVVSKTYYNKLLKKQNLKVFYLPTYNEGGKYIYYAPELNQTIDVALSGC